MLKIMKKFVLMIVLTISASAYAINFPTYRPVYGTDFAPVEVDAIYRWDSLFDSEMLFCGYSTVATGGRTTDGDGSIADQHRNAPRRSGKSSFPSTRPDGSPLEIGDYCVIDGITYYYLGNPRGWSTEGPMGGNGQLVQPGVAANGSPIGSPILPFLLMALMACGVIYYRHRKLARA